MSTLSRIQNPFSSPSAPSFARFGFAGACLSALEVGGDFFELVPLSETVQLMVIADVMGKGLPASLFADSLRTLVRALAKPGVQPSELLSEINQLMFEDLSSADMFITLQIVRADLHQGLLHVSNAGHCPLLLCDGSGCSKAIAPDGLPLGIQLDATFRQECAVLPSFGAALLYTDGLTEARNRQGHLFGEPRLTNWLSQAIAENQTALHLKASLLEALHTFQAGAQATDDQTFLILADEKPRAAASLVCPENMWPIDWQAQDKLVPQIGR